MMQRCFPFNIDGFYLELINPPRALGRTPRELSGLAETLRAQILRESGCAVVAARVTWREDGPWLATEPCCTVACAGI